MIFLNLEPELEPLRSDPRYKDLLRRSVYRHNPLIMRFLSGSLLRVVSGKSICIDLQGIADRAVYCR
jgi:hypothetical protein